MKRGTFSSFHFSKRLTFVLGPKMGIFYREKVFHAGKKLGKVTLPPQKNIPLTPLGFCTSYQKLASFVLYLKIINTLKITYRHVNATRS